MPTDLGENIMEKKVSIVIPYYPMKNHLTFLMRCLDSINKQTYRDFEVIITMEGKSAENTNAGIKKATGDLIKILHMDDYFTHPEALQNIVDAFKDDISWLVTGCSNNLHPILTGDLHLGNNKLGGPSVVTLRKGKHVLFDESMVWLFDCDFYKRMITQYGEPEIMSGNNVTIGEGEHQATNTLSDEVKQSELFLMRERYV